MTSLEQKILALVSQIPKGKITTYQIIAHKIGNKNLARAVGNALNKNPQLITIPCHRVVRNDQKVGNYAKGLAKKIKLLQNEGILINGEKIANFYSCLYHFN